MKIELLNRLAEILEVNHLDGPENLSEFPAWDSLGSLSFVALAKSEYGVEVDMTALSSAKTVGDLISLVMD